VAVGFLVIRNNNTRARELGVLVLVRDKNRQVGLVAKMNYSYRKWATLLDVIEG
jgi:hypothetical protein